jgi:hypothetical protein
MRTYTIPGGTKCKENLNDMLKRLVRRRVIISQANPIYSERTQKIATRNDVSSKLRA